MVVQLCDNSIYKDSLLVRQHFEGVPNLESVGLTFMILHQNDLQYYQKNQGYIYVVHAVDTDRYKIGRTINLEGRLKKLGEQSVYPLKMVERTWTPDAPTDEAFLHKFYEANRRHGEWFQFLDLSREEIERICSTMPSADSWETFKITLINDVYYRIPLGRKSTRIIHKKLLDELLKSCYKQGIDYDTFMKLFSQSSELSRDIRFALCDCTSLEMLEEFYNFISEQLVSNYTCLVKEINEAALSTIIKDYHRLMFKD